MIQHDFHGSIINDLTHRPMPNNLDLKYELFIICPLLSVDCYDGLFITRSSFLTPSIQECPI